MIETKRCDSCDRDMSRSPWPADRAAFTPATCGQCRAMEKLSEVAQIDAKRYVSTWKNSFQETLIAATGIPTMSAETGVPQRVAKMAKISGIPAQFMEALPKDVLQCLMDGVLDLPDGKGFGLDGAVAVGKTCAVGALVKRALWAWLDRAPEFWDWADGRLPYPTGCVLWVTWPRVFSWLQAHAVKQDEVGVLIKAMTRCKILVLDDLGREGVTRSAASGTPYALRILDDIVSLRYDSERPLLWTSNNFSEFNQLYDAACISRLVEMAPLISVSGNYLRPIQ